MSAGPLWWRGLTQTSSLTSCPKSSASQSPTGRPQHTDSHACASIDTSWCSENKNMSHDICKKRRLIRKSCLNIWWHILFLFGLLSSEDSSTTRSLVRHRVVTVGSVRKLWATPRVTDLKQPMGEWMTWLHVKHMYTYSSYIIKLKIMS